MDDGELSWNNPRGPGERGGEGRRWIGGAKDKERKMCV